MDDDLDVIAARWRLGFYDADEVRELANRLLARGVASSGLIELYATPRDELRWTVDRLFPEVLAELGVDVPSEDQAWRRLGVRYARAHLQGTLTATETTDAFFELVLTTEFRYEPLIPLYALHDEPPERVVDEVRAAAAALLAELEPTVEPHTPAEPPPPRDEEWIRAVRTVVAEAAAEAVAAGKADLVATDGDPPAIELRPRNDRATAFVLYPGSAEEGDEFAVGAAGEFELADDPEERLAILRTLVRAVIAGDVVERVTAHGEEVAVVEVRIGAHTYTRDLGGGAGRAHTRRHLRYERY